MNLEEIRQSLEDYRRTTLMTLGSTLVLALALIALLFRFSMQPIRQLTEATRALSRRHFMPVPVPPGNDEMSQLARSFNQMTKEIQAFIERERSFTRYASHELRTPLSTLRAQVEALELKLLGSESVIPALKETLEHMERILNGLLTLARAGTLNPRAIPLTPLVQEVLGTLPEGQRERVTLLPGEAEVNVLGQSELLKQALVNLLDNALKYSSGPVTVRLEASAEHPAVAVCDEGEGVPDELLKRLPSPFFQVDASRGGVGLGLTLVRHIAESLEGKLELRNTATGFEARMMLVKASVVEQS